MIIGVTGRINSGKGTVSGILVREFDFTEMAFADPLKVFAREMFNIPTRELWGASGNRSDRARQILQELGTDFARKYEPDVWIRHFKQRIRDYAMSGVDGWAVAPIATSHTTNIVISDLRFPNEAKAVVEDLGGAVIRVIREGSYDAAGTSDEHRAHESERAMDDIPPRLITHTIQNDGTLADLEDAVRAIAVRLANNAAVCESQAD